MTKGDLRTRQVLYLLALLIMIVNVMFVFPVINPGMGLIQSLLWSALIWFPMMGVLRTYFPENKMQPPFDDDAKFTG